MSAKLILVRGLPGSGKSTLAREHLEECRKRGILLDVEAGNITYLSGTSKLFKIRRLKHDLRRCMYRLKMDFHQNDTIEVFYG